MAPAVRATFAFLSPRAMPSVTLHRFRLTPPSASSRFPPKGTKRKNHLRPKILKTLTKPLTTVPLPQIVPVEITVPNPISFLPENEAFLDNPCEELPCENFLAGKAEKLTEFQVSETINRAGVFNNISATSVLKFCVYLVGAYMIQTICAFWFLGSTNSSEDEKRLIDLDGKRSILLNGSNVPYSDGVEMEGKISEIRAMAKEARKREKIEREDDNKENNIEREIGARLAKMEKRLSSKREKLPGSVMNHLGLFGSEEDGDGVKDKKLEMEVDQNNLIYRKKLRFRSPSMASRTNPKGFSGKSEPSSNIDNESDPNGQTDTEMEAMNKQFNSSQTDGNNLRQEKVTLQTELDSVTESSRLKKLETKQKQNAHKKSNGFAKSSRQRNGDLGKRPMAKVKDRQSAAQTDLWWLNLPYVLAVLMRRGPEHKSAGLYALRMLDGLGESSYTVAFEDRGDANNFCHLLELFFEDLGDFRADIVPLSTKDIQEEVKSRAKQIIVVKKGQLKLYAGQPFAEVEMALHSLLGQD